MLNNQKEVMKMEEKKNNGSRFLHHCISNIYVAETKRIFKELKKLEIRQKHAEILHIFMKAIVNGVIAFIISYAVLSIIL